MRTLYLLNLDGNRYGIWKDEISSITDVRTVHRIPLSPDCIAGVSVIDGRSTALADLGACIGVRDRPVPGPVKVLFVAGKKNDSGFAISGGIDELEVPSDAVHPLPDYLKTPGNDTCVIHGRSPIPVINLTALYDRVHERSAGVPAPALLVPVVKPAAPDGPTEMHLFKTGGELFAFPCAQVPGRPVPVLPDGISGVTRAPRHVRGLAYHQKDVLPVISLAERMGLPARGGEGLMAVAELPGAHFGFLIDEYLERVRDGEAVIRPLPAAASTGWASAAVLYRGGIIPLLEPAALLAEIDREDAVKRLPRRYSPDGRFPEAFDRANVDVMEFSLLGVKHALPKTEVEDIVPFKPYRRVPDSLPIVIGITEHNGEVLPVLDLAMVFGRRSLETPEWKMILVKNGDFRAFVITERPYGERMLPRDIQRKVPIVLPHALVYGCYPEGVAVRLILNVEALTVHFDRSVVRDLLPALTLEMAAAPSELVPSLLPEEHLKEETAASLPDDAVKGGRRSGPETGTDEEQVEDAVLESAEAEQSARREAEAKARAEAEENVRRAREEELRRQAAEEQARRASEELTHRAEEDAARCAAEEKARLAAEEQARREAEEERKRLETAERTRKEAEEAAHQQAEAEAQRAAEKRKKIEEDAQARREAEEKARQEAEELSRRAEEERTRLAAEEEARKTAEEQRRLEEEARARQEFRERARREAEEKARQEAEELSRRAEQEAARRATEEKRVEEERKRAAAAAIRDAERITRERELVRGVSRSNADRAAAVPSGAAAQSEERSAGQERQVRRKYIAIAAGLVLVSLLYFGSQRRLGEETSGDAVSRQAQTRTQQPAQRGDDARDPVVQDTGKEGTAPEPGAGRSDGTEAEEKGTLVLTVPPDRQIETDIYIVKKGDTLWAICRRFTGDPFNYPRVARDNSIADPDLIFPGQRVRLKK